MAENRTELIDLIDHCKFAHLKKAEEALGEACENNGFAASKRRSTNKNSDGLNAYNTYSCWRGGYRPPSKKGETGGKERNRTSP